MLLKKVVIVLCRITSLSLKKEFVFAIEMHVISNDFMTQENQLTLQSKPKFNTIETSQHTKLFIQIYIH